MTEKRPLRWQFWLKEQKLLDEDFRRYRQQLLIRKIEPSSRLSAVHIGKAFHNLDFASFTAKNQDEINRRVEDETYHDWVIVISYYAMYHAAMALLYRLGYKASTHLATICVLCKECLGTTLEEKDIKIISRVLELHEEEIRAIGRGKERRERASYSGSVSFERHLAEMTIDDAQKFVNKIADVLDGLP